MLSLSSLCLSGAVSGWWVGLDLTRRNLIRSLRASLLDVTVSGYPSATG
jgi:hypothetical protein